MGCKGSSESTLIKMQHCWKPHATAHMSLFLGLFCGFKLLIFSYPSVETFVLGIQKNRLNETVLLSTQNICFGWEIRKSILATHSYLEAC